jgi:hypothetical protein
MDSSGENEMEALAGFHSILLGFNDTLNRADGDALLRVEMAFALHAGGLVNHVEDAVAFADGVGGADGNARAARDAIFFDLHCHGNYSFVEFVNVGYSNGKRASIDECREFG